MIFLLPAIATLQMQSVRLHAGHYCTALALLVIVILPSRLQPDVAVMIATSEKKVQNQEKWSTS